eukprot:scaffold70768_cov38-Prasinocladus_malaysianus.AAC.3
MSAWSLLISALCTAATRAVPVLSHRNVRVLVLGIASWNPERIISATFYEHTGISPGAALPYESLAIEAQSCDYSHD